MKTSCLSLFVCIAFVTLSGCQQNNKNRNSLNSLSGTPEYSIKFIAAELDGNGKPKKEVINGTNRLAFRELTDSETKSFESIIQLFKNSQVIKKALELRWEARSYTSILSAGKLGVEDRASDPFYVVLGWSENTLEASPDPAVIYSGDAGPIFSSVRLIVTGLGPVPFSSLTSIPFISETIIMHEIMHCVQFETMGSEQLINAQMASTSMNVQAHKIYLQTDMPRAFMEGFAEAFERIAGELVKVDFKKIFDDFVAAGPGTLSLEQFEFLRDKILAEELRRQAWIREDYFGAFDFIGQSGSVVKYGRDILNSEGVVATTLYNFLMHSDVNSVYSKMIATIVKNHPSTLVDFFTAFGKEFPDDRNIASAVFIRQTLGVTRNPLTMNLFKSWRESIVGSASSSTVVTQAKQRYDDAIGKEVALLRYDPVLNSLLNKPLKINTKDLGRHYPPFSIDLNQDSLVVLTMIIKDTVAHYEEIGMESVVKDIKGREDAQAQAIINQREALHNLGSLNDLDGILDANFLKILRSNFMQ